MYICIIQQETRRIYYDLQRRLATNMRYISCTAVLYLQQQKYLYVRRHSGTPDKMPLHLSYHIIYYHMMPGSTYEYVYHM